MMPIGLPNLTGSGADVSAMIQEWCSAPDISARSLLVTVFGDTLLPVTDSLWLAQLFRLTDEFGFSHRLVRTSMFRLAAEGWVTNERVGRQSRYTLTELARRESEQADGRIYHDHAPDWQGDWTLVMLDHPLTEAETQATIAQHLAWSGFIQLSRSVLASPTVSPTQVTELIALIEPGAHVAVATAEFSDLSGLVSSGFFAAGLRTAETEAAYGGFIERYQPIAADLPEWVGSGEQAFALRTMLIHDLRRIRLRAPDVPAELLPPEAVGHDAHELAAGLYSALSGRAASALSDVFELDYPAALTGRFDS